MGWKRTERGWVRDEVVAERPIRSEHREEMEDLKDLANRLAALPRGQRRQLPLSDEALSALDELEAAAGRVDRRRVLMRAKGTLADVDRPRLEAAMAGDTPAASRERVVTAWRTRLVAGGDEDLQQFVETWPAADRTAIRTALREARKSDGGAARLARLLRAAMTAAEPDERNPGDETS